MAYEIGIIHFHVKHVLFFLLQHYVCTCIYISAQQFSLFPFEGQREKELSFPKGAIIDLLHTVNENWLEGMVGQTKGIFPTSYVQVGLQQLLLSKVSCVM